MNPKLILYAFLNSIGVLLYVSGISWFLFNGERFFGKTDSFWMPAAMLLIFVVSATIVGALVLGRSIYLYLENNKREAIKSLTLTLVFLLVITGIVLIVLV